MNLFFVGLNVPPAYFASVLEALRRAPQIFPNLASGESYVCKSENERNFVLMQHSDPNLLGNRNYIAENESNIVFYSGLPVDPSKQIQAHRAESLLKNFDNIKYNFEGQACLVRFNKQTNNVDIVTDNLGMEQVYFYNENGQFIFSNHIHLIETAAKLYQLDPKGVSYYLSIGWAASDSTLRKDIKLITGGQHWHWDNRKFSINKKTYFDVSLVKVNTKESLKKENIKSLSQTMAACFSVISENFDIECPLTGGQDSRLAAAFLLNQNLKAKYYTTGNPMSQDAVIASMIARKFNLTYRIYEIDENFLNENWNELVKKFILQNNGLASLYYLAAILTHFGEQNKINIRLATHAATAARVCYNRQHLLLNNVDKNTIISHLKKRLVNDAGGLIYLSASQLSEDYIESFVNNNIEKSVPLKILPDLFCLYERVGRFHGNNWHNQRYIADSFDVFCCKSYLTTSMQIYPLQKITSPLHFELMHMLNKELMKMPFEGYKEFGIQNIRLRLFNNRAKQILKKYMGTYALNKGDNKKVYNEKKSSIKKRLPAFNKMSWFINNLENIRMVILDQSASELWHYINRNEIEKILLDKEGKLINPVYLEKLFNIITLFYYEHCTNQRKSSY